jgi:glutamate dehydrogenase/leucine dehydrogenase/CBS domain-containing protein
MIPQKMGDFLRERLPTRTWKNRLIQEDGRAYMEFGPLDVDRLLRLGIEVDRLGPSLVACMWDEESGLEIGGYLVVDNLAMGRPSMGGIRMLPDLTPAAVHNLARGMTLKNAAADLPYGGGKSGIVAPGGSLNPGDHDRVVEGFARLLSRYTDIYLPGPDVGTNDSDMKTVAVLNGLDNALSKPVDMGGNRIDELGAAAGGVVIALDALLQELPRLQSLPQFKSATTPPMSELSVLIQGFGAVGAHAAKMLRERYPECRVIGMSDMTGYLYDEAGLPVEALFEYWQEHGVVVREYYEEHLASDAETSVKFSTNPDDLLRESAFCLIPAAPIAHYLDIDPSTNPCMTVDHMGDWTVIIEGANTYSPDPDRKAARARMERAVYRNRGVLIATDYLVNSGGVIFAAQEHLIKTPGHLRIPEERLGDREAVEGWLQEHAREFGELAAQRLEAADIYREEVIRRNMRELVDLLTSDPDMLPLEAAERISVRRIASSESSRKAADIMAPIPTVSVNADIRSTAEGLIQSDSHILAVVSEEGTLLGVVTEWDITNAVATGGRESAPVAETMTKDVISIDPGASLLEVIRSLEHYEISAMPVVAKGEVLGMVSTDLLATRSLLRLLQSEVE